MVAPCSRFDSFSKVYVKLVVLCQVLYRDCVPSQLAFLRLYEAAEILAKHFTPVGWGAKNVFFDASGGFWGVGRGALVVVADGSCGDFVCIAPELIV